MFQDASACKSVLDPSVSLRTKVPALAKQPHDREDLLREGKNLPWRGQFERASKLTMIGFRAQGQLSIYCDGDPVFQFNADRQLRRVYFAGQRYAAQNRVLVVLTHDRKVSHVQLQSTPVDPSTADRILSALCQAIEQIRLAFDDDQTHWDIVEPQPGDFDDRLRHWLQSWPAELNPASISIAAQPNA